MRELMWKDSVITQTLSNNGAKTLREEGSMNGIQEVVTIQPNGEDQEQIKESVSNAESSSNKKTPREYYLSEDYEVYFVEYIGDIKSSIDKIPYADIYSTGDFYGFLFVENGRLMEVLEAVPEIISTQRGFPFTLSELNVSNNLNNSIPLDIQPTTLQGEGVIVGIISTGIDYLNPRFTNADGSTRIVGIWDETLNDGIPPDTFVRGTEFSSEEINEALKLEIAGGDPYTIVKHKDEVGHGTAIAGVIGGRNLGEEDSFVSVVPKCEFAIVKLQEAKENALKADGIKRGDKKIYQDTDISAGIRYLRMVQSNLRRPMVVYVALGSNSGGHGGETVIERYIDFVSQRRDFAIICNTGNQGNADGHASGTFEGSGDREVVPIGVAKGQGNLIFAIYISKPDKITIGITSPNGESVEPLTIPTKNGENFSSVLEGNNLIVKYSEESQSGGIQRVDVLIENAAEGTWNISLKAEVITNGRYDLWLMQKELLEKEQRFLNPDEEITLMTPSTAQSSLTTSYYNQRDNSIIPEAGKGFTKYGLIKPSIAVGTEGILTLGLNNDLILASGAAMAGALITGAAAMIYQWGVVEKNDINIYPPKLRSYVISATLREEEGIYPNPSWGYGRFSFNKLLNNLSQVTKKNKKRNIYHDLTKKAENETFEESYENNLYTNIPGEVYNRLMK